MLDRRRPDGSWLATQRGDGSLAPPLVLLLAFLGEEHADLAAQTAHAIRADQRPDGAWSRTPGGPADVSASVLAYFALKIVGDEPTEPHMRRARDVIRQLGGADAADADTRRWLALFGQVDHELGCPILPEWLLLSDRGHRRIFGANWSRSERLRRTALAVLGALRPTRTLDFACGVRELFLRPPQDWPVIRSNSTRLARVWTALGRWCERAGLVPLRPTALAVAETLLVRDALDADPCGTGFEELVWRIVALRSLGYPAGSTAIAASEALLRQLIVVDEFDAARPRPTANPVGDTLCALAALTDAGVPLAHPQLAPAAAWLADCLAKRPTAALGAAPRELASLAASLVTLTREPNPSNALPPDMQLSQDRIERLQARQRRRAVPMPALRRLLTSACDTVLSRLPALEPPDELGPVLEMIGRYGLPANQYAVHGATIRLRIAQQADGSWQGASNTSAITTAAAIRGLVAMGTEANDPAIVAGLHWLCLEQLENGAWGDAVGTAEAVRALVAAGEAGRDACRRGVQLLVDWAEGQSFVEVADVDLNAMTAVLTSLSEWAVAAERLEEPPVTLRLVDDHSSDESTPSPTDRGTLARIEPLRRRL